MAAARGASFSRPDYVHDFIFRDGIQPASKSPTWVVLKRVKDSQELGENLLQDIFDFGLWAIVFPATLEDVGCV